MSSLSLNINLDSLNIRRDIIFIQFFYTLVFNHDLVSSTRIVLLSFFNLYSTKLESSQLSGMSKMGGMERGVGSNETESTGILQALVLLGKNRDYLPFAITHQRYLVLE